MEGRSSIVEVSKQTRLIELLTFTTYTSGISSSETTKEPPGVPWDELEESLKKLRSVFHIIFLSNNVDVILFVDLSARPIRIPGMFSHLLFLHQFTDKPMDMVIGIPMRSTWIEVATRSSQLPSSFPSSTSGLRTTTPCSPSPTTRGGCWPGHQP